MTPRFFFRRDDALLLDIVLAARDARSFVIGMDCNAFRLSRLHQNAVIRSLEIIGEAAGRLSPECRETLPQVAWSGMIGMRNRLIHHYGGVRVELVWAVVETDLPQLLAIIEPLIPPPPGTADAGR